MKITDKVELKRLIENRSSLQFYNLIEPIIQDGIQTLKNDFAFDEVSAEEVVIGAVDKAIGKIHLYDPSKYVVG